MHFLPRLGVLSRIGVQVGNNTCISGTQHHEINASNYYCCYSTLSSNALAQVLGYFYRSHFIEWLLSNFKSRSGNLLLADKVKRVYQICCNVHKNLTFQRIKTLTHFSFLADIYEAYQLWMGLLVRVDIVLDPFSNSH